MKHFLTAAACALVACAGITTPILAGSFGLFYAGRHCNDCGVCVRQYNAFTPIICGDLCGSCGGCDRGGCGGGCGPQGCGYGGGGGAGYGCDPGYRMQGRLAPIGAPCAGAYCGALGHCPADGYGMGAFGTQGCGRLSLFGMPGCGGCSSCCGGNYAGALYGGNSAGFQGYGLGFQGYDPGMPGSAVESVTPPAPVEGNKTLPAPAVNPDKSGSPKAPATPAPASNSLSKTLATTVPGSARPAGVQAQPVSYQSGYPMTAQPMMPSAYNPAAWGYPGYSAYPGYPMPMMYPTWGYPAGYPQGW